MRNFKKTVLRSFLFIGLGVAIATVAFAVPYDLPGKPGQPCIEDFGTDFCLINYTAPKYEGGSPIKGYLIQYKSKFGAVWTPQGTSTGLRYYVTNMIQGDTGELRVQAENKAGFGEPSEPSFPVTFRPR